jgi:hypothetical protein
MIGYLDSVVGRALGEVSPVRPRLRGLFESFGGIRSTNAELAEPSLAARPPAGSAGEPFAGEANSARSEHLRAAEPEHPAPAEARGSAPPAPRAERSRTQDVGREAPPAALPEPPFARRFEAEPVRARAEQRSASVQRTSAATAQGTIGAPALTPALVAISPPAPVSAEVTSPARLLAAEPPGRLPAARRRRGPDSTTHAADERLLEPAVTESFRVEARGAERNDIAPREVIAARGTALLAAPTPRGPIALERSTVRNDSYAEHAEHAEHAERPAESPLRGLLVPERAFAPLFQRELATAPEPAPTINVTIGRVEIRAAVAQPTERRAPARAPRLSLDAYLHERNGGRPRP